MKEISIKIFYICESDNQEIIDCDSGKTSLLLTEQADE